MAHGNSPRHARKPKKAAARKRSAPRTRSQSAASGKTEKTDKAEAVIPSYDASVRLQKLLASAGFGSRRDVERFISEERVTVNGRAAKLGDRADPAMDEIRVDGERLARERPTYWIVNKPRGVLTTVRDDEGRRTVIDLVPRGVGRIFPVGRLDKETSGLLLMTNDGDVAHALLHPSLGNEREYRVNVKGQLDAKSIGRLEKGVTLEEGRTSPMRVANVRYDPDSRTSSLSLTLVEGKKRQIRRSLLVLGHPVRRLVRVRMGPLVIGRLAVGEARPLRSPEKKALLEHVRRLRAGEPVLAKSASAGSGVNRGASGAAPPRPRETRRTRSGSKAKKGAKTGAQTRSGRPSKSARKPGRQRAATGSEPRGPKSTGRPRSRGAGRAGTEEREGPGTGRASGGRSRVPKETGSRRGPAKRSASAPKGRSQTGKRASSKRSKPVKTGSGRPGKPAGGPKRQRPASSRKGVKR